MQERSAGPRLPGRTKRIYGRKRFPKDREWIERRGRRKKGATKAEIRRAFENNLSRAVSHITIYNRIDMAPARREHLEKALEFLEKALEIRPGQHLLRKQRDLCLEELKLLLDRRRGHRINVLLKK